MQVACQELGPVEKGGLILGIDIQVRTGAQTGGPQGVEACQRVHLHSRNEAPFPPVPSSLGRHAHKSRSLICTAQHCTCAASRWCCPLPSATSASSCCRRMRASSPPSPSPFCLTSAQPVVLPPRFCDQRVKLLQADARELNPAVLQEFAPKGFDTVLSDMVSFPCPSGVP